MSKKRRTRPIVDRAVRRMCAVWAREARSFQGLDQRGVFLEYVIASLSCSLGFWLRFAREPGARDDQQYGDFLRKIWEVRALQRDPAMTDEQWHLALVKFRCHLALNAQRRFEESLAAAADTKTVTAEVPREVAHA